jgi:hypothetical protein
MPANITVSRAVTAADIIRAGMVIAMVIPVVGGIVVGVVGIGNGVVARAARNPQKNSQQTDADEVFHRSSRWDPISLGTLYRIPGCRDKSTLAKNC